MPIPKPRADKKQDNGWGAVPASRHEGAPLADPDATWDASSAVRDASVEQLRDNMALFERGDGEDKSDYSFPHHRPDGTLVKAALQAAMARLNQGYPDGASDTVRRGGYNHLTAEYERFDMDAPEFKSGRDLLRRKAVVRAESPDPQMESKADGGPGGFYGYVAVFNNIDWGGEVILPGAFRKSLAEHDQFPLMVRHATLGGDVSQIVGSFTAKEDDYGLWIDATYLDDDLAQSTREKTDKRIARGLSVGYREIAGRHGEVDGQDAWLIEEAALIEGTITIVPMNEKAVITATKSLIHSRALETLRTACADGPGRGRADLDRESAESLLVEIEEAGKLLRGYLSPQPSGKGQDRLRDSGDVEARRKRLGLARARARLADAHCSQKGT